MSRAPSGPHSAARRWGKSELIVMAAIGSLAFGACLTTPMQVTTTSGRTEATARSTVSKRSAETAVQTHSGSSPSRPGGSSRRTVACVSRAYGHRADERRRLPCWMSRHGHGAVQRRAARRVGAARRRAQPSAGGRRGVLRAAPAVKPEFRPAWRVPSEARRPATAPGAPPRRRGARGGRRRRGERVGRGRRRPTHLRGHGSSTIRRLARVCASTIGVVLARQYRASRPHRFVGAMAS